MDIKTVLKNKILWGLIILTIIFHIVWYSISCSILNNQLPPAGEIQAYRQQYIKELNVHLKDKIVLKAIEEQTIKGDRYNLHLDILSSGKGKPTVVFIPGTSLHAFTYIEFMHALYLRGFNVVGLDPRGHGQSGGPRADYTIPEIVDDTQSAIAYARNRFKSKVSIIGSSQGGIAALYAAARDDSITAAVCNNMADLNGRDNLILSKISVPPFLVPASEFLLSIYKSYVIPLGFYLDMTSLNDEGMEKSELVFNSPLRLSTISFRALKSLQRTGLAKPVEAITVPMMVVQAEKDYIFPQKYTENLYKKLTCPKKYTLLKDRKHMIMINYVPEIIEPISSWLKSVMKPAR